MNIENREILQGWLFHQCQMVSGAISAELLTGPSDEGPYNRALSWPDDRQDHSELSSIAQVALRNKQAVIRTRNNAVAETDEPLDALACPLFLSGQLFGVVAIGMTHRSQPMQQSAVKQVQDGAKWLETMIQLQSLASKEQLINLVDLVATGLDHGQFRVAVTEVANELAERFFCQRVSLGFLRYHRVRVDAISHTSRIDQNSKEVRAIRDAMSEALDQGTTVVYPVESETADLVIRFHAHLANAHQGAAICTFPLIRDNKPVGALLMERAAGEPFVAETVEQCKQIALLLGPVLETRRREERSIAAKIFDSLKGWFVKLLGPHYLPLKVGVALSVALLLWLSLATATFRISSNAVLEAGISRAVVAPQQGYIATAHARAGDLVREGDPLATLDDRDLRLEQRKWQSLRAQLLREYQKALAGSDRAEVAILSAKRSQAEAQLALVEQQLARTNLVAPFSGLVIKGDLSQALGSPVGRGDVLYEVAPIDDYRVILKVDERDIGLAALGQQGQLKLSGIPDLSIGIRIHRLTPVSTSEEGRNYFRVEALMESNSDLMRPGMEGIAKIEVGEEKLLRIWTRHLVDWLRLFVWKHLP